MRWLLLVLVLLAPSIARAHKPSDSYLSLEVSGKAITARWDIALRDLDYAIGLDADGDGSITWREVKARNADIDALALLSLEIQGCQGRAGAREITRHSDGVYAVVPLSFTCAHEGPLQITYRLFFDQDPQHRGLVKLTASGKTRTASFSSDARTQRFDLESVSVWRQLGGTIKVGVVHIWEGFDHLLFLLALLLPSVLRKTDEGWEPVQRFRAAVVDVLKIVTAFTIAHSVTLSLAALNVVRLPSRFVESAIAASVLAAALNNVFPVMREQRWQVAFALGLLHGFGFSATLADLELPRQNLVLALLGFNAGVELGQAAVVALFVPLAFVVRRSKAYRWGALVAGSVVIGALACVWIVERAFELKILS